MSINVHSCCAVESFGFGFFSRLSDHKTNHIIFIICRKQKLLNILLYIILLINYCFIHAYLAFEKLNFWLWKEILKNTSSWQQFFQVKNIKVKFWSGPLDSAFFRSRIDLSLNIATEINAWRVDSYIWGVYCVYVIIM